MSFSGSSSAQVLFSALPEGSRESSARDVLTALGSARMVAAEYPEVATVLDHPAVTAEKKQEVIRGAIGEKDATASVVFGYLAEECEFHKAGVIARSFQTLMQKAGYEGLTTVTPAEGYTEEELKKATDTLGSASALKADAGLLGGVKVRKGDTVVDASYALKLKMLQGALTGK